MSIGSTGWRLLGFSSIPTRAEQHLKVAHVHFVGFVVQAPRCRCSQRHLPLRAVGVAPPETLICNIQRARSAPKRIRVAVTVALPTVWPPAVNARGFFRRPLP